MTVWHEHAGVRRLNVESPDFSLVDPAEFSVSYDEFNDTMFVYLTQQEIAPVSVLLNPNHDVYALVDPVTETVVGLQIEAFLSSVVTTHPVMILLAFEAGISPEHLIPAIEILSKKHHPTEPGRSFGDSVASRLQRWFGTTGNTSHLVPA